ncbi:MAG: hypothetical protein V4733_04580 [Verrucomicrobiota bacterium]
MTKKIDTNHAKNPLEWIVFVLSVLLLIALFVFLASEAKRQNGEPARFSVETGSPIARDGMNSISVTVKNTGGEPAVNVRVQVTASANGTQQSAEFLLDHVPSLATRTGSVAFRNLPRDATVSAIVAGYMKP